MDALAALADIARRAVAPTELGDVLQHAVVVLGAELDCEHATVLELAPEGDDVRLRAGIGWEQGFVGRTVDAMPGGYVAFALASDVPVVVPDRAAETRFAPSPVLLDTGVRSSIAVRIPGTGARPYGVVGVHSERPRAFTADEIGLVSAVAVVLTSAIARHRQAIEINDELLQTLVLAHYAEVQRRPDVADLITQAIGQTQALINTLLGAPAAPPLPGDLRRVRPAVSPPDG